MKRTPILFVDVGIFGLSIFNIFLAFFFVFETVLA